MISPYRHGLTFGHGYRVVDHLLMLRRNLQDGVLSYMLADVQGLCESSSKYSDNWSRWCWSCAYFLVAGILWQAFLDCDYSNV